jgi:hypothetical protein
MVDPENMENLTDPVADEPLLSAVMQGIEETDIVGD